MRQTSTGDLPDELGPGGLDTRDDAQRAPVRRGWILAVVAGLAVTAIAIVVLALTLPGTDGLSVRRVAELALLPSAGPRPDVQRTEPRLLDLSLAGVPFPRFAGTFGWEATGSRDDTLEGRLVRTAFYELGGRRIGYTIVSGDPIGLPGSVVHVTREDTDVHIAELGGRSVVTWLRQGHTCVLSSAGVDRDVLLELAAWHGGGAIPF